MPSGYYSVGLGAAWKGLSGSLTVYNYQKDKNRADKKSYDFQLHYYKRTFVFDIIAQNYKGLYLEEDTRNPSGMAPERPDINITKFGLFSQYIFNNNKFSYRAAFSQNERQVRSAGSLLVGAEAYYTLVEADSSFIQNVSTEGKPKVKGYQIGPNIGYAYTCVIKKRCYVTAALSLGLNIGFAEANYYNIKKTEINPSIFPRISAGYNADDWSLTFSYVNNKVFISRVEDTQISLNSGNLQLSFVKRFDFNYRPKFLEEAPTAVKKVIGY
jgi:hypothetical protein